RLYSGGANADCRWPMGAAEGDWHSPSAKRLELISQNGCGDLEGEDLVGPLVDPADARVFQVAAGPEFFEEPAPAEHLDGAVGGVPRRLRGEQLGLGGEEIGRAAGRGIVGSLVVRGLRGDRF